MSQKSVSASFFTFNAPVGNCPALLAPVQGEGKRQTASEILMLAFAKFGILAGRASMVVWRCAPRIPLPGSGHQLRHLFAAFVWRSVCGERASRLSKVGSYSKEVQVLRALLLDPMVCTLHLP